MRYRMFEKRKVSGLLLGSALLSLLCMIPSGIPIAKGAQAPQARTPQARTPQSIAPLDLTGYWVSLVTEDWRYRMIVPDKGDFQSVPLNPEGIKVADTWDPARDQADGNQCKSYAAPAIMRVPGRLHITWENDNTLRIDTDSGTQTRLLHFGADAPEHFAPQWQGYSLASWEGMGPQSARAQGGGEGQRPGYLKVVTTHLKPGYLRKNGVPYSANAELLEYFDSFKELNGDIWLVVTTIVTDPQYLTVPFVTSTHFRKQMDASGWDPTPCRANEPR